MPSDQSNVSSCSEAEGKGRGPKTEREPEDRTTGAKTLPDPEVDSDNPGTATFRSRMRKWLRAHLWSIPVIALALVALVVGSVLLLRYLNSYESTDDAEIDGHLNPITARISGTVIKVYVENNQPVGPSETLADLDPTDYRVAVEKARADLAQARGELATENPTIPITVTTNQTAESSSQAGVDIASAGVLEAEERYQSSLAQLRQAEANNVRAQRDEVRYRELVEKDETSRQVYAKYLTEARASNAVVDSRRAAANAANKVVGERQAALGQARTLLSEAHQNSPQRLAQRQASVDSRRAAVEAAKAQLDQSLLNLNYCKILAPVGGIVGNRNVEVGQRVQAGEQLLEITEVDDLWVTANFKETQLSSVHPGQRVTIHIDTLDRDFTGYVESMPGATGAKYSLLPPENATGNYVKVVQRLPVRIRFDKNQLGLRLLRQGMSVEPKVWMH